MNEDKNLFQLLREVLFESMRVGLYVKIDEFRLTFLQRNIIMFIAEYGNLKMTELCKLLAVQKPAMTRLVDNLEKRKYVKRTRVKDDRRGYIIVLASKGTGILNELGKKQIKIVGKMLSVCSENDKKLFFDAFEKFRKCLKAINR